MLIQDFIQIPIPFDAVGTLMQRDPRAILGASASEAYREGEALLVRLSPSTKHPHVSKRIAIDIGMPYARGTGVVIPVHWWATGPTRLFPRMDADLEIVPLGDDATQITLMGRYEAPLASLGKGLDRMLLHRVAEASVRSFLHHICAGMDDTKPETRLTWTVPRAV